LVRPNNGEISERPSLEGPLNGADGAGGGAGGVGSLDSKVTTCQCSKEGGHFAEVALETVIPGTPERIHNLMFASGFIKDFLRDNQKLTGMRYAFYP
jgi:hypothetical protein